jgi:hypothetical protein
MVDNLIMTYKGDYANRDIMAIQMRQMMIHICSPVGDIQESVVEHIRRVVSSIPYMIMQGSLLDLMLECVNVFHTAYDHDVTGQVSTVKINSHTLILR